MSTNSRRKGIHLGIIPDGSRRWAKLNGIKDFNGEQSGKTADYIVRHILKNHPEVDELSLWAMSTENVDRDDYSRNLIYNVLEGKIKDLLASHIVKKNKVKINVVGSRLSDVPQSVKDLAANIVSKTRENEEGKVLNICIGYGRKQEILNAVMGASKWLRKKPLTKRLHENVFEQFLLMPRPLDIMIRTGGEKRLSGFMLYQIEYAELFFTDTLWPDFSKKEFDKIMKEFSERERRFGK